MRIVHISTFARFGGAGRAAFKIHNSMVQSNIESRMLVMYGNDSVNKIYDCGQGFFYKLAKLSRYFDKSLFKIIKFSPVGVFSTGLLGCCNPVNHKMVAESDVICVYWINGGFLSLFSIRNLLNLGKPVVWRLSDMWAFTDGAHYTNRDKSYTKTHGLLSKNIESGWSYLSRFLWSIKAWMFKNKKNLTIVCPSNWMKTCVEESSLLKNARIVTIHTGIDVNTFCQIDQKVSRSALGLPECGKIILFGAVNSDGDLRKGGNFLFEALEVLDKELVDKHGIHIAIFGARSDVYIKGFNVTTFGHLDDDHLMAMLYSACDVFVAPSVEENLANTVLEAMACGTPTVAFDIGGMPDIISTGTNGYLAEPFSSEDLAKGISSILALSRNDTIKFRNNSRDSILSGFTLELQLEKFEKLFIDVAKNH